MFPIPTPKHELQYRALGLIRGVLQPVQNAYAQGMLVTASGEEYPATPGRAELLGAFSHCLETEQARWFYVQPQPRSGDHLGFSVIRILSLPEEELEQEGIEDDFPTAPVDVEEGFNIRGEITLGKNAITVTVKRKPQGSKQFPPLTLKLQGFLPGAKDGEFWDLLVEREGHQLILVDGKCVQGAAE
jgi:hypothetical protein